METLTLLYSSPTTKGNPSIPSHPTPYHPVVERLKALEPGKFNYSFRYISTKSEEFGEEQGYISTQTLEKVNLVEEEWR